MTERRQAHPNPDDPLPTAGGGRRSEPPPRRAHSSDSGNVPMEGAVLDRHSLITTIESRLDDPSASVAFLLLVVIEDAAGQPVHDSTLIADVGRHLGAMIRATDLIATLNPGELAMVVFDLPPVQRVAFADGIAMALDSVLERLAPDAGLRVLIGTSSMRADLPITDAFRLADRQLSPESERSMRAQSVAGPAVVG